MNKLCALMPAFCLAACTTPQAYQTESPKMDFITYFTGTTYGAGAIHGFTGKVTDRFHVHMQGTPGTDTQGRRTLYLAEDFTYASGKTQKRAWSVTEITPGHLTATAPDVPGKAEGIQSGNAIQFRYPLTITRDNGKKITLSSNDWMWMAQPGEGAPSLINRNKLSKFGVPVAELVIMFNKPTK